MRKNKKIQVKCVCLIATMIAIQTGIASGLTNAGFSKPGLKEVPQQINSGDKPATSVVNQPAQPVRPDPSNVPQQITSGDKPATSVVNQPVISQEITIREKPPAFEFGKPGVNPTDTASGGRPPAIEFGKPGVNPTDTASGGRSPAFGHDFFYALGSSSVSPHHNLAHRHHHPAENLQGHVDPSYRHVNPIINRQYYPAGFPEGRPNGLGLGQVGDQRIVYGPVYRPGEPDGSRRDNPSLYSSGYAVDKHAVHRQDTPAVYRVDNPYGFEQGYGEVQRTRHGSEYERGRPPVVFREYKKTGSRETKPSGYRGYNQSLSGPGYHGHRTSASGSKYGGNKHTGYRGDHRPGRSYSRAADKSNKKSHSYKSNSNDRKGRYRNKSSKNKKKYKSEKYMKQH